MTNGIKGFRSIQEPTKKQVKKENYLLQDDLKKSLELSKMIVGKYLEINEKVKNIEYQIQTLLPIQLKIEGLVNLLIKQGIFNDGDLKSAVENSRIEYLNKLEIENDKNFGQINVDREAKNGDIVVFQAEAFDQDGLPSQEMSNGYILTTIGDGLIFKEVNDALIGMTPNSTKYNIEAIIPENHLMQKLIGKKMYFNITLLRIKEFVNDENDK